MKKNLLSQDNFAAQISNSIRQKTFAPFVKNKSTLESSSKYYVQDLIGEGPISGFVDENGNDLVLFDDGFQNSEILKAIYLSDYPIKNKYNNTYNFSNLQIYAKPGTEFQTPINASSNKGFSLSNPGILYSIEKNLYGLNYSVAIPSFISTDVHSSCLILKKVGNFTIEGAASQDPKSSASIFNRQNFEQCFGAYHEIKDEFTDFVILALSIKALYQTNKNGSTLSSDAYFGIEVGYKLNPDYCAYVIHKVSGIATSEYKFDLFFDISDLDFSLQPYLKVYNFSQRIEPTNFNSIRNLAVVSVVETSSLKFKYPNSCYFLSVFDSRGFAQPPNRKFDMKMLKVKVPENYDSESKTYNGFWNGEFDPVLRWTDNPAWILYDIITNYRYGVGKFSLQESVVDKWSLYKIAKYCDEMVPTNLQSKFPQLTIGSVSNNAIYLNSTVSLNYFQKGKQIDLVNLGFQETNEMGEVETVYRSFKAIISNVSGSTIEIIPFFGLHKIFSLFPSVASYVKSQLSGQENIYEKAVSKLIEIITIENSSNQQLRDFITYIKSQSVFGEHVSAYIPNSGLASCKFDGFPALVEPRFRANISLSNETDVINLLNNVSSVFKGLVYWSNNFINFDNDRPKNPSYFFNNSNVKDGIFNYASSSRDTRYTVAKVIYADETDSFKDKTVYVEDQTSIKKYGYVEKEIIGFGITSKSQARRIGEWFLTTNIVEQEIVTFITGPECLLLSPGNVVKITDQLKLSGRKGGRVAGIAGNIVILDDKYDFIQPGDSLSFIIPAESVSPNFLNEQKAKGQVVKDSDIDKLTTTYLYTFAVSGVGLDGNFRTQITLDATGEKLNLINSIGASTLWVYEKNILSPSTAFNKDYRIVSIKEKNQIEYEISAVEFASSKFNFIENRKDLTTNNLFSDSQNNIDTFPPKNIAAQINPIIKNWVNDTQNIFDENKTYDYLIPSFDYDYDSYQNLIKVMTINNIEIFNYAKTQNINSKGFVLEYSLNSKKISYVWREGDQSLTTIAAPTIEIQASFENLRVYMIGEDDKYLS